MHNKASCEVSLVHLEDIDFLRPKTRSHDTATPRDALPHSVPSLRIIDVISYFSPGNIGSLAKDVFNAPSPALEHLCASFRRKEARSLHKLRGIY
eukprot:scaffold220909_cov17-Tisochrysis_lutea.AAC.2